MCIRDANLEFAWDMYSMQLLVSNMHSHVLRTLRPRIQEKFSNFGKQRVLGPTRIVPQSPLVASFPLFNDVGRDPRVYSQGNYDRNGVASHALPTAAKQRRQNPSVPLERQMEALHLGSGDEDETQQGPGVDDSGVGGMSEDGTHSTTRRKPTPRRLSSTPPPRPTNGYESSGNARIVIHADEVFSPGHNKVNRMRRYLVEFAGKDELKWVPQVNLTRKYPCELKQYREKKAQKLHEIHLNLQVNFQGRSPG